MNDFRDQLGALANNVGKDFERASADDSAALIRRAKRGRVVWTGTVGTATLASIGVLAIGGNAAARGVFGETISPAATLPAVSTSATPTPTPTPSDPLTTTASTIRPRMTRTTTTASTIQRRMT